MVNAASPRTTTNGFVNTATDPFSAVVVATPDLADACWEGDTVGPTTRRPRRRP